MLYLHFQIRFFIPRFYFTRYTDRVSARRVAGSSWFDNVEATGELILKRTRRNRQLPTDHFDASRDCVYMNAYYIQAGRFDGSIMPLRDQLTQDQSESSFFVASGRDVYSRLRQKQITSRNQPRHLPRPLNHYSRFATRGHFRLKNPSLIITDDRTKALGH